MARRDPEAGGRADRKGTAKAAQLARARLLIKAHLGWLGGYPGEVGAGEVAWRGARVERIDRAVISEGTRALKRLTGEHAAVLPQAVRDVDAWTDGVTRGLEALKRAVHGGALGGVLDSAAARHDAEVRARYPTLEPVLDALAWMRVGDPDRLRKDLRWIDNAGDALAEILRRSSREDVLALVQLAEDEGARKLAALVELLGDPAIHDAVTEGVGYASTVLQRIGNPQLELPAERPGGKLGAALLALPKWLAAAPAETRKGALRAIAATNLRDVAARWAAVWTAVERELARRDDRSWDELKDSYDALKRAIHVAPPALNGRGLKEAIQRLATRPGHLDVLEKLPTDHHHGSRAGSLVRLANIHDILDPPEEAAYLELLRAYLGARRDEPWSKWYPPVEELIDPMRQSTLTRVNHTLKDATQWRRLGQAMILASRTEARALDGAAIESLASLVRVGTAEAAVEALRLLRPRQRGIDALTADAASALTTTPGELVAMAETIASVTDSVSTAVKAIAIACGPGGATLVRRLIERGERARIIEGWQQLHLADALKLRRRPMLVAPDGVVPPWATAMPEPLRAPLARLLAAGGENAARKILGDTYPDVDALDAEIAAIEKKLETLEGEQARRLANRLANLQKKLVPPKPPSPTKLANLVKELTEAAEVAAFERWRAALAARIDAQMPTALELETAPAWLATPAVREVIGGILQLHDGSRKLAHRLLAARCGPAPWDLRDDPANRAFVTRMRRAGIDPAPWVDGIGVVKLGAGDDALDLALEDDPLEVLRMGGHYETCLAPGAINFFAAVVNAADINKRVIYGRGKEGNVVGRCLLALTDTGGILAFHCYCHDERDFTAMVREFVKQLAARMSTVILPAGAVSSLLSAKWYDDGPEDLTGQFTFLEDGSTFRASLAQLLPDELVPALAEKFAPLPLGGHTLGLIIGLSELDQRPALIVPLMPLLDELADIPLELRLRAAALCTRAGRPELAAHRLARDLDTHLRALHRQHRHIELDLLERLVVAAPSRALAFLRDTRERHVRDYADEREAARMWAAARAHELLGRRKQAEAMFRSLAQTHKQLREACDLRLAALAG